jgi:conjugative relaxase-like TrwC/TraI family protein
MLTLSPMKHRSVGYYNNTAKAAAAAEMDRRKAGGGLGEYYTEGETRAPTWLGVGDTTTLADLTGLSTSDLAGGEADMDVVERWLDDGIAPNEASGRAFGETSVHGFDLTFCAPKSVSLLRALSTDDVLVKALTEAHHTAVRAGMEYLSAHAGYTRVHNPITGEKDLVRLPGLVAAAYQHETSRAGDPHLHSHVLLFNKQARSDGELVSVDSKSLHHEARAAGMIYQVALRHEMHRLAALEMGDIAPHTGLGDIAGVPKELITAASQRSTQLREWAHDNLTVTDDVGPSAAQLSAAQKATRPAKPEHQPWAELRGEWAGRFGALEVDHTAQTRARRERESQTVNVLTIARQAAADIDKPAFTRADLIEAIGARMPAVVDGSPAPPHVLLDAVVDHVGLQITEPRRRHEREGHDRYTVEPIIAEEAAVLALMGARNERTALPEQTLKLDELSAEQARVIDSIARSPWLIQALSAPAGAGKTTSLRALREATHRANEYGRVLVLAPTGKAVDEAVQQCAGDTGYTIAKALKDLRNKTLTLEPRTLVIVDEAGMVGTPELRTLLTATTAAGVKTVLVGDPAQLAPVRSRGGMFAQLCDDLPWSQHLTEVWRMHDPAERTASLALRHGGGTARRRAVDWYRRHDRLHTGDSVAMAHDAFDAYNRDVTDGKQTLLVADTWEVADALNTRIHHHNAATGAPTVSAAREHHIGVGDIIISRRNDPTLAVYDATDLTKKAADQVRNGHRWHVYGIDPATSRIAARRIGDDARTVFEGDYLNEHVHLGYAVTVHAAQGTTVDACHSVLSTTVDHAKAYVALTRGRATNNLYLYDKIAGEGDHEHAQPTPGVHVARRGNSRDAAAALREALSRDHQPETVLAAAAHTDPKQLPDPVRTLLDTHDRTRATCQAEHRRLFESRTAATDRAVHVDIEVLRAEVDYLDSAGGVSGAGMYPPPPDRYASVPEADRRAVAAVAGGAQSVQVLTVGDDGDKAAALTAIAAAARTKQHRILALPATDTAKAHYDEHPYADRANTPQVAHDRFTAGQWTAPPGTLIVVDDADHLTAAQVHCFTDNAVATNTKLLLITTPTAERQPSQTLVDTLATHLPWTQHIGTPAERTPSTAIEQARLLADTHPELGDPTNWQHTRDLLDRADTITRAYRQRISHRTSERDHDRSRSRSTHQDRGGLEL